MSRAWERAWSWKRATDPTFGLRQYHPSPACSSGQASAPARGPYSVFVRGLCLLLVAGLAVAGAPASPAAAGPARTQALKVGAEARSYILVPPDDAPGPRPVLIALHGAGQSAQSFRAYAGFDAAAKDHGFVVVYPQGIGRVWNDGRPAAMRLKAMLQPGDDEAFLVLLAHRLVADGIADPARIYLAGISNGGFMVQKMACEQAQLFAAYVSIMATAPANYEEGCHPARAVPLLMIHGTADSVIAYDGFWTPVGATLSAPDSAALYARLDGCGAAQTRALPDLDPADGTNVVEKRWSGCRDGVEVALMSVQWGGHQSPAQVDTMPDLATPFLGLRSRDIDAGEEIWRFVSPYALPPPPGSEVWPLAGMPGARAVGAPATGGPGAVPLPPASTIRTAGRGMPLPTPSPLRGAQAAAGAAVEEEPAPSDPLR